jgi:hypothetical protein
MIFRICLRILAYGPYSLLYVSLICVFINTIGYPPLAKMSRILNPSEDDFLRQFAVTEEGRAKYPIATPVESPTAMSVGLSNVVDLNEYRRLKRGAL